MDACCEHMVSHLKPKGHWTIERCMDEAINHGTRVEWKNACSSSYGTAVRKGWLEQCCAHMPKHAQRTKTKTEEA